MNVEVDNEAKLTDQTQWSLSTIREQSVKNNLWLGEDREEEATTLARGYSLRRSLLEDVARASMEYALAQGGTRRFYDDAMQTGANLVDYLESSLTKDRWASGSKANWNFWHHQDSPGRLIKEGKCPYIERDGIISTASSYLQLPYRAPRIERTLIDVLIAAELFAYGDEIFSPVPKDIRQWLPIRSPIQQRHALLSYLRGRFWDSVLFLGGAALAAYFLPRLIGQTATDWIVAIAIALFFVSLVLFTVLLPFAWRHQAKARQEARDLIIHMTTTYAELADGGIISTRRLRELAQRAADAGVAWPGPVFALLDDNIARGGLLA